MKSNHWWIKQPLNSTALVATLCRMNTCSQLQKEKYVKVPLFHAMEILFFFLSLSSVFFAWREQTQSHAVLSDFPCQRRYCMYKERKWHITQPLRCASVMVCSLFPCSSNSVRLCRFWKAPGLMLLIWLWASRSCWSPAGRALGTDLRWLWLAKK